MYYLVYDEDLKSLSKMDNPVVFQNKIREIMNDVGSIAINTISFEDVFEFLVSERKHGRFVKYPDERLKECIDHIYDYLNGKEIGSLDHLHYEIREYFNNLEKEE